MLTILKTSRTQVTQRMITANANTSRTSNNVDSKLISQEFFSREEIEFERREDVIYHLDKSTSKARLCILKFLMKEIFAMTHDDMFHAEFHRAYATINETLYIRRLSHHLRQYIAYCPQCFLNQTKRVKLYEALNLISSSKISFHTISMNFILVLSIFEKFDTILTIIDKFFKEKLLMSDQNIWKAKDWALILWKYLQLCNWDLSRAIIFDRDAKFRFEIWKALFKVVEIDLLMSTAYHSQTDEQSERINQTIEIALRFLLTCNDQEYLWHNALSFLQQKFMNTITSTKYSSNQILYEFNIIWKLSMLNENYANTKNWDIIRQNVAQSIDFVSAKTKVVYDRQHKSLTFNVKNKAYLRLHHEYFLLEKENSKLSNQRSDSYIILRKISNLAYELNLSETFRIHSVIFIAQLKSTSDSDSYERSRSINFESIEMKNDIVEKKSFEVERILKKRNRKYERITMIQYLVKWKKWKFEHNSWVFVKDCSNFMKLVMKFENKQTTEKRE